jgi:hypothetical protein
MQHRPAGFSPGAIFASPMAWPARRWRIADAPAAISTGMAGAGMGPARLP